MGLSFWGLQLSLPSPGHGSGGPPLLPSWLVNAVVLVTFGMGVVAFTMTIIRPSYQIPGFIGPTIIVITSGIFAYNVTRKNGH